MSSMITKLVPKFAYFSQYMRMAGAVSVDDIKARQANDFGRATQGISRIIVDDWQ